MRFVQRRGRILPRRRALLMAAAACVLALGAITLFGATRWAADKVEWPN